MEKEIFQELWLMTGTEKEFEDLENHLQELGFDYQIAKYLDPGEKFSIVTPSNKGAKRQ